MSLFAWVTLGVGGLTLVLGLLLLIRGPSWLKRTRPIQLGVVALSGVATYKLVAFFAIAALPVATLGAAHVELLEGAKSVEACAGCHVMWPMVNDLHDPASDSLAARHFKNRYIQGEECYHCHSGYGFNGALSAKLEGYRHLVRYTTGIYQEPIRMRGKFDTASCLNCHEGTRPFEAINSHHVASERLAEGTMSCTNCHGPAHPTRSERTPGDAHYQGLMRDPL